MTVNPGSLVRYREREWIVLPSEDPDLVLLRPLGGSSREVCGVVKSVSDLVAYSLPYERITPATFPLPDPALAQDHAAVRLLQQAARLLLREGAAPFRSLGQLSIRPRPYQFVPLIMAFRLETIRLLISDDVGVGKTIEAALIARELLDRGEIRRLGVLCPPYLCDQWQGELAAKFGIDAVVIRSGTIARLERDTPPDTSIFQYYPHFVASIDTVKGDRYRANFLQHCPEFVIVDEVHGAARPPGETRARAQQQRHELLRRIAADGERHLLLLSATPHSGVETSFLSILGLLRPEFQELDPNALSPDERAELARHFVQRRRADVRNWMGVETHFPERDPEGAEQPYTFSRRYRAFYNEVYEFARQLVRSAETMTGWRKRMRFWSALALMRCVTSSPAAAEVALRKRIATLVDETAVDLLDETTVDDLDAAFAPMIHDPTEVESTVDAPPSGVFDLQAQDPDWGEGDRRQLRHFARTARELQGDADHKLQLLLTVVDGMLRQDYHPIVWCRYIATADYVAAELEKKLVDSHPGLKVTSVTGALGEDERRLKVEELAARSPRVLVATDCLSEGINLQEHFTAVVHYDLPWNPNRLEQREGRVDRFGQRAEKVKAVLIFGEDNPVDGAVLEVLLRKARDIYRTLGVRVPMPVDSETVMSAVLNSLFLRARPAEGLQLSLFETGDESSELVRRVHDEWTRAAERERESRTRFAQRAIKPEEVERELEATDRVLGDPDDIARFLADSSQRLGFGYRSVRHRDVRVQAYHLDPSTLPPAVALRLGKVPNPWPITFHSPAPEDLAYIGRNHPLIEGLAEHLLDLAFHPADGAAPAARAGAIRTDAVARRTVLLLLRLRYLQYEGSQAVPTLAEETLTWGFSGSPPHVTGMSSEEAQALLDSATPVANVPPAEREKVLVEALEWWPALESELEQVVACRAGALAESHERIRRMLRHSRVRIEPQMPPDLLGIVVLLPVPGGVRTDG
ncbi:MAG: helicase [Deltaproteobacteria bacterium]|nr:helicase [Deltaproteobacteria bacterium]